MSFDSFCYSYNERIVVLKIPKKGTAWNANPGKSFQKLFRTQKEILSYFLLPNSSRVPVFHCLSRTILSEKKAKMEAVKINRSELHAQVWKIPAKEICLHYDLDEYGLDKICHRLNVPMPDNGYWRRLSDGKTVKIVPLPEKFFGTYQVILYRRDELTNGLDHRQKVKALQDQINPGSPELKDYSFDKLVISTKEGINKHWEQRTDLFDKSKLLAVFVSPEMLWRALNIIDLLLKGLRFKGHELIVEQRHTYVAIAGEKIQISVGEKNRRVEFINNYGHTSKDLHPTGVLYLKKEGSSIDSKEWKDGPKKGTLEQQMFSIITDFEQIAQEQKDERERWRIHQEEQEKLQQIKRERELQQRRELAQFKDLLFESHRFALSTMIRSYVAEVESKATSNDSLSEEVQSWIAWAKKSADWYDPTLPKSKDDVLAGVDIENLRVQSDSYYYHEEKERNFWKPWWSK